LELEEPPTPEIQNAITIGTMTGSTIQQGSPAATQNVRFTLHIEAVRSAVEIFENALQGTKLPAAALGDITADVQTIKAQLSKPSPSIAILKEAGKSVRNVMEGIGAGILTPAAAAAAAGLWAALGLG
jgi:hypothetical protein